MARRAIGLMTATVLVLALAGCPPEDGPESDGGPADATPSRDSSRDPDADVDIDGDVDAGPAIDAVPGSDATDAGPLADVADLSDVADLADDAQAPDGTAGDGPDGGLDGDATPDVVGTDPGADAAGGDAVLSTCFAVVDLASSHGPNDPPGTFTFEGSTVGRMAQNRGSCGDSSGNEEIFTFTPPGAGTLTLHVSPGHAAIYVRTRCEDPSSELSCSVSEQGFYNSAPIPVAGGVPVFVFIDAFADQDVGFNLNLVFTAGT